MQKLNELQGYYQPMLSLFKISDPESMQSLLTFLCSPLFYHNNKHFKAAPKSDDFV